MTRDEMYSSALDIIYLAACAINNTIPDRDRISKMNLSDLHAIAEWHMVDSIAAMALISAGIEEPHFMRSRHVAVARNALFNNELKNLIDFLEREKIWYVLLKGTVIKRYYPEEAMRQVGDADIFFDVTYREKVHDYFVNHGFEVDCYKKQFHDSYIKLPVYVFEMHVELLEDGVNTLFYDYYKDVSKRLIKAGDSSCEYHFSDEDMYIHIIGHEYNHYSKGGTGLRSLIDTYVYINRFKDTIDFKYIEQETEKLGIGEFEKMNRRLALKVFEEKELDPEELEMFRYIIESGTYGTAENEYANKVNRYKKTEKASNKMFGYVMERVFIPMYLVRTAYPFFYRHKYLMPFLIIYRLGRALTTRRKEISAEYKVLKEKKLD